jgi:hypothetical protein
MTNFTKHENKRPITPLWIISLFVSLTETILGFAVTQTDGMIQIALTSFVIIFPIFIAGIFFLILWNKPFVLYPPTEYGKRTDVSSYVNAMQKKTFDVNKLYTNINNIIHSTLSSEEIINKLGKSFSPSLNESKENQVANIIDTAVNNALENIRDSNFITIDTKPLLGIPSGKILQFVYNATDNVWDFLTGIWITFDERIPSFTFATKWALRDSIKNDNLLFNNKFPNETKIDKLKYKDYVHYLENLTLFEAGINPGMRLEAIPYKMD